MSTIFERPEPVMVAVELSHYEELVRKATLYDAYRKGEITLNKELNIIGGEKLE